MKHPNLLLITTVFTLSAILTNTGAAQRLLPGPEKNTRAAAPNGIGNKRVAVILFNWSDNAIRPVTQARVRQELFTNSNSTNAFFKAISFDQLSLKGDVYGWYTLPVTGATNEKYVPSLVPTLNRMASRNGFREANYDTILYTNPRRPGLWAGQAFGKKTIEMNGWNQVVAAHEILHLLGLDHANGLRCTHKGTRVAIGDDWSSVGYGDPFDIQGNNGYHHPNAYSKARMGWLKQQNFVTIPQRRNATLRYFIRPLESSSSGTQCVRVPVPAHRIPFQYGWGPDPLSVDLYYYIEYRQPSKFDDFQRSDPVVNGVSIRLCTDIDTNHMTMLVDTRPETTTFHDAPLTAGRTFTDPVTGVTIRTLRTNSSYAEITVTVRESDIASVGPHMLWTRKDGTASLWTLGANERYARHRYFGAYPGMNALGYHRINSKESRMLWSREDGLAKLWSLDVHDNVRGVKTYGPFPRWTARCYHKYASTPRLLWSRTDGLASLWTLNDRDEYVTRQYFGPYAGWTARSYQRATNTLGKMLWSSKTGMACIWTMNANNQIISKKYYGPYSNWTPTDHERLPNGSARLVWTHSTGAVNVWKLDSGDNFTGYESHGRFSNWSAHDYSAK
jgi:hypothetical protein